MRLASASSAEPGHPRDKFCQDHKDTKTRRRDISSRCLSWCLGVFVVPVVTLRVAVIGVGHLGKHHARILSSLPGVTLAAVVDTNRARAEEIAAANATRAVFDAGELLGHVDAVTIAVPTELHYSIALPFLKAGVPVLVEKPIVRTLEEAD